MKVLVTGATGFTGSYVIPVLLEHGIQVRCYVRSSSNRGFLPASSVEWAVGDIGDEQSLSEALEGVDAFVNIASLGVGHAETIVNTSAKQVKRAIYVSTTALFTTLPAKSKLVRLAAEDTITKSALDYTILRPTMIYGSSRDRNICRLIG